MPTLAETLKENGLEISEDLAAKLPTLVEGSDEVKGLKSSRDNLLAEKTEAKKLADEAAEKARIATEEKAKKDGDYETLMKLREEDTKKSQERFDSIMRDRVNERKQSIVSELANKFESPTAAKLMLSGLIDVNTDSNGVISETYKGLDGNAIENGSKGFIESLSANAEFAALMKGSGTTGAGANNGGGKPSTTKQKRSEMSRKDKHDFIQEYGQAEFLKLPK